MFSLCNFDLTNGSFLGLPKQLNCRKNSFFAELQFDVLLLVVAHCKKSLTVNFVDAILLLKLSFAEDFLLFACL